MIMKITLFILSVLLFSTRSFCQILTWSPLFATVEDTITIIYDATQGNRGLVGATEVYAHTGVITDKSSGPSDWKHVKTNWGDNTPATRLTNLGGDKWQIRFHIRSYYGLPAGEKVKQLAFVFRNANSTREGKTATGGDIFLPIYEQGLNLALLSPTQTPVFMQTGDSLQIRVVAGHASLIELEQDGVLLTQSSADTLSFIIHADTPAKHRVKLTASDGSGRSTSLDFYYIIRPSNQSAALPTDARDGIQYRENSAQLVLFAPHKSFVYLIGDFSNWEADPAYLMNRTPEGDHYWLQIDGLTAGKEYGYQYWVDGNIKIADPYTDKVLDPDYDSSISRSTYPDLLAYPKGKTTEIVSVLQPGKKIFQWKAKEYQRPPQDQLVIYELLIRDFVAEHTFSALIDRLNYLHDLGVTAVELMPINEFEGNSSWGYNPSFYFAPDKYYGPGDDLKRFIDAAHSRGIAVIQDIVLNHSYGQSSMVRLYADQPALSQWFNTTSPNPVYAWGYDFNHSSPATQAFVDRVLEYWLTEYHVDGFRFDFSKGFTNTPGDGYAYDAQRIELIKRMADRAWAVDSTAYLILEHFADNREEKELAAAELMIWGNCNATFNEATMGWHDNNKSDLSWGLYSARGWSQPNLVTYIESHDEERLMMKNLLYGNQSGGYDVKALPTGLKRVEAAAAFFLMMPGPKMIWQFGELGYDVSIDYNGRTGEKPVRWNYFNEPDRRALYDAFAAFILLKKQPALTQPVTIKSSLAASYKWMKITFDSLSLDLVANFDVTSLNKPLSLPHAGKWFDYMSGDSLSISNIDTVVTLAPGEYHLLLDRKVAKPQSPVRVKKHDARPESTLLVANYPNPFNPVTTIRFELPASSLVSMVIYDAQGRQVRLLIDGFKPMGSYAVSWDGRNDQGQSVASGLYFCKIQAGQVREICKMTLLK
jgi:1,4-alpha-glucan branching enzyme